MAENYDYHFMVLAPGLEGAWFFQAARQFWQVFQPIVTEHVELIEVLPAEARIAVTVLTRSEHAPSMRDAVQAAHAGVALDLVVSDDLPLLESILNRRAESGIAFG